MILTTKAKMDCVFYDETPAYVEGDCEVKINKNEIVVSYEDDEGVVNYKGEDEGHGHFVLKCPEREGRATFHQMLGSRILEGYWQEGGHQGFWRITLPKGSC